MSGWITNNLETITVTATILGVTALLTILGVIIYTIRKEDAKKKTMIIYNNTHSKEEEIMKNNKETGKING